MSSMLVPRIASCLRGWTLLYDAAQPAPAQITILESSGDTMVPEELRRQLKLLCPLLLFAAD